MSPSIRRAASFASQSWRIPATRVRPTSLAALLPKAQPEPVPTAQQGQRLAASTVAPCLAAPTTTAGRARPLRSAPGELETFIQEVFPCDPPRQARAYLPRILEQLFPLPDTRGVGDYAAYLTVLFGLNCLQRQVHDAQLLTFLRAFAHTLRQAACSVRSTADLRDYPAEQRLGLAKVLVRTHVVEPLQHHAALLVEGGFKGDPVSHATAMYFTPQAEGRTLLAVLNRSAGEGTDYHLAADDNRVWPLVWSLPTAGLHHDAAQEALAHIFLLQLTAKQNDCDAFYRGLLQLADSTGARLVLGPRGARSVKEIEVPAMSRQKGGTCAMHCVLATLQFAMHAEFGTLSPSAPPEARAAVQQRYKNLKLLLREAIVGQVVQAAGISERDGDWELAQALRQALQQARGYVDARVARKPELRALAERLSRLERVSPRDPRA